jgi:hypothetical protein
MDDFIFEKSEIAFLNPLFDRCVSRWKNDWVFECEEADNKLKIVQLAEIRERIKLGSSFNDCKVIFEILRDNSCGWHQCLAENDTSLETANLFKTATVIEKKIKNHFNVNRYFEIRTDILASSPEHVRSDPNFKKLYELEDKEIITKHDIKSLLLTSSNNVLMLIHNEKGDKNEDMFWGYYDHSSVVTPNLPKKYQKEDRWYAHKYLNNEVREIFYKLT